MDSVAEESGQDLDDMSRIGDSSENSRLVNSQTNAKMNVFNIVNNILCVIFTVYIIYLCFVDGATLFSFHPTLMTVGWLLLMVSAINSITPGDGATEWMPVRNRTTRHWVLQSCALISLVIGFIIIVVNKFRFDKPHFATLHSCFGLAAFILALCAASGGLTALYSLKFKKIIAPVYIKIVHSCAGLFTFAIGMVAIILGLFSAWFNGNENFRIACVVILLIIALLTMLRPSIKTFVRIRERITYIRSSA